jgi:NAD(P)-dependent dehydrogenase (short-subunit alcohol dehydrogenase family)
VLIIFEGVRAQERGVISNFEANLSDRVVLVTGASRGIGKAIALAFARQKCRIVIMARDSKRLAETALAVAVCGAEAFSQTVDVSDEDAVLASLTAVKQKYGRVDVLVNNAGIYKTSAVIGHSTALWQETINVNLTSAFIFCRELAQPMVDFGWGRIINISSISGKHAEIQGAAYSVSKSGLIGLTQALALELAASGVTVNAICPGWVDTDLARGQLADPEWCKLNSVDAGESMEIARLSVPQMRFLTPEEVASLTVFLCGDSARGITGQAINICGGMCLS